MIYIALNVVLVVACVLLSVYVDSHTGNQSDNPLIPMLLVLASCAGLVAFCILISSVAPARLTLLIWRFFR